MPVRRTTRLTDGFYKDEFETTPIMSTYLIAFVVADFLQREKVIPSGLKVRIHLEVE